MPCPGLCRGLNLEPAAPAGTVLHRTDVACCCIFIDQSSYPSCHGNGALPSLLPQCCPADALLSASPDFQTKLGYPLPPPNGANLSTASKANAQKYNTLSLVLEQPFKDCIGELRDGLRGARTAAASGQHVVQLSPQVWVDVITSLL